MAWRKFGLVLKPDPKLWWMLSHAWVPTPERLEGSTYRIWFAGRNDKNQSHVGFAVVDLNEPDRFMDITREPVFSPGPLGCFDDNGVIPTCILRVGNELRMYYAAYRPGGTTRFFAAVGLAISTDGGHSFARYSAAPILGVNPTNPYGLTSGAWVVKIAEGWRMYYVAGTGWLHPDQPLYNIQVAWSPDGLSWTPDGISVLDYRGDAESSIGRPVVQQTEAGWRIWYCYKLGADSYRPGYAESEDGIHWKRFDDCFDLTVSPTGPDQDMIAYPIVLEHEGQRIVYYNGNDYGREGICLAVEE